MTRAMTGIGVMVMLTLGVARSGDVSEIPFAPEDVDWDHPVYATEFDDREVLQDWVMEGDASATIAEGSLVLASGAGEGKKTGHLVFWLKPEMPADFLLEFTFRPQDRRDGLAIVFFSARGKNGESIFDPKLPRRNGAFRQYHSGEIDNYHVSYWSGSTRNKGQGPSSHIRKNHGFFLVAEGRDLVVTGRPDVFQTIRIYKRGGAIRVAVDGVLAVAFDDDGKTYGPVHDFPGRIGLRQMAHTGSAQYGRLAVYPLKKRPTDVSATPGPVPLPAEMPPGQ